MELQATMFRAWAGIAGLLAVIGGCGGDDDGSGGSAGTAGMTLPATMAGGGVASPTVGGSVAMSAGTSGLPAAASGGSGNPPIGGAGLGGAGGASAPDAAAGDKTDAGSLMGGADASTPLGPTLPAIPDPGATGPFGVDRVETVSGLASHSLFVPDMLNNAGKHPTVVWTCGNGGTVSFYASFLEHLASHGFLVVADKGSSSDRLAEVASQKAAIDWLVAESSKSGGDFSGKIDLDNIAVMGHSLGSLASFATAAQDPRIATSVHYSGGLTGNPVGFDEAWLKSMTKPAAFLCGGSDTTAGPSCKMDFDQAPPTLPVFYGVLAGATHIGPFGGTPRAGEYGRAGVAWLRWQLADDPAFEPWFAGAGCKLCASPWSAMQRNLE